MRSSSPPPQIQQKSKFDEDEDVSIAASAVQNLSVSKSLGLASAEVGEDVKSVIGSVESATTSSASTSDLVNSWVDDFRVNLPCFFFHSSVSYQSLAPPPFYMN